MILRPYFHRLLFFLFLSVQSVTAQEKAPIFADLHCHSLLKPYYSGWGEAWGFHEHDCPLPGYSVVLEKAADVPKFTQSNFESLVYGGVRVAFVSITPLEIEMRHPKIFRDLERLHHTYACMVGMQPDWDFFLDKRVNYFEELCGSFRLLESGDGQLQEIGTDTLSYEVIRDAQHFRTTLADPQKLAVLVTIEGAHSLGEGPVTPEMVISPWYAEQVLENVDYLKGIRPLAGTNQYLDYPVSIMTLNHFMWNGMSGHAKTFGTVQGYFLDQSEGLNGGVTHLGEQVIARLLDRTKGRRILVDVKHMSLESRKWYYQYVQQLRAQGDTVPIVATHVGIAGRSWEGINPDKEKQDKDAWLNQASISLFEEDIRQIHLSGGVLGLMLDKYRCGGPKGNEWVDATREGSQQRREAYIHLLVANMLSVVDVIKAPTAWDIISIGSDFDGMINAMEPYDQGIKLPSLRDDLVAFFSDPQDIFDLFPKRKIQRYMFHLSPEELVDKVMGGNLVAFADRILTEDLNLKSSPKAVEGEGNGSSESENNR